MPARTAAPVGAPCWIDLQTSDPGRSREFYAQLLGWTPEEASAEFGGYFRFTRDGVPLAGCMKSDAEAPMPDVWSIYLATDDIEKTLEAAGRHGGQVVVPAMPVADLGTMGFVVDVSGAAIGLWEADQFTGFGVVEEPGAPAWFELFAREYRAAVDFYREVFGWDTEVAGDTPEFRYTTMRDPGGDGELAGIMDASGFLPEGVPSHWSVYLAVEDVDRTLARAVQLGGSVLREAEDTPYGRLAQLADSTGAAFRIVDPDARTRATP
ncbi:MAG: VOC family protein [Actinomycetales bacterium]|nr:VOC family protein [Actinomycetales bacterium]